MKMWVDDIESGCFARHVGRSHAKGAFQNVAMPREINSGGHGDRQPLMSVKSYRVSKFHSVEQVAELRNERSAAAPRCVDVEPEIFCARQTGNRAKRIDGSGVGCAGGRDDQERSEASG